MALALVGEGFLSALIGELVGRVSEEVISYFKERNLKDDLLKKLKLALLELSIVLADAEEKQYKQPNVKEWLNELKDAVFDADDLLDEFATEASRQKLEADQFQTNDNCCKLPANLLTSCLNIFDNNESSRIRQVLDKLEDLADRTHRLKLENITANVASSASQVSAQTSNYSTYFINKSNIVGREKDLKVITNWLLNGGSTSVGISESNSAGIHTHDSAIVSSQDAQYPPIIVTIVGIGGMGKSTLARLAYDHIKSRDTNHFSVHSWVDVPKEFDVVKVTKIILGQITSSVVTTDDLEILQDKLKKSLRGNKFLLVFDNVWDESASKWYEYLRALFSNAVNGSKILVTTRSYDVARTMHSIDHIHHIQRLHKDEPWELFSKIAFLNKESYEIKKFEDIGKKIAEKCDGLPLALKSLGSLCAKFNYVDQWKSVLQNDIWTLQDDEIIPSLKLSYHHLPSRLKQCFAFCSIFPKGFHFIKDDLISLWMAHNFLAQPRENKRRLVDIGRDYFDDLESRSFFKRSSGDDNSSDFVMHDLIHDLARFVSGEFGDGPIACNNTTARTRHLTIEGDIMETYETFKFVYMAYGLRTLLPLGQIKIIAMPQIVSHTLPSKLKCLRVLSFRGLLTFMNLPDTIGDMKHLRSIDLSETAILRLPDSICSL